MKFVISTVSNSSRARIGTLKNFHRLPELSLETPMLFLYTKGGCVPHLTLDVLQSVTKESLAIQLPLPTTIQCHQPLTQCQDGIGNFIGMKDCLTYCSIQDPAIPRPPGYNMLDKVSIWSKSGKEHLDVNRYMDIMESFRPDMYQCLGDGETNMNSTNKRIEKSVKRSLSMFHKCLQRHRNSEVLKKSAFIAILQGGYDVNERLKYAKEVAENSVDGFAIDGLHENNPLVEFIDFEKVKLIISETLKEFTEDKLRIVHGCWNPETILKMVELGIDAFDASFPFVTTERGAALTFLYKSGEETSSCYTNSCAHPLDSNQKHLIEDSCKEHMYEINLEDKMYAEDFQPLLKDCKCLCCKQHTRAYIHHLLCSKELLARVLLMIHNLHHYLEFFKAIRLAVKEDNLCKLRSTIFQKKIE